MENKIKVTIENNSDHTLELYKVIKNGRITIDFTYSEDDFLVLKYMLTSQNILTEDQIEDLLSAGKAMNKFNMEKSLFRDESPDLFLCPNDEFTMNINSKTKEVISNE